MRNTRRGVNAAASAESAAEAVADRGAFTSLFFALQPRLRKPLRVLSGLEREKTQNLVTYVSSMSASTAMPYASPMTL